MAAPYLSVLFLLPLLIVLQSPAAASQMSPPVSLPGCRNKCGNITVPYPFGFEPNCFREDFKLVCNESYSPPQLFIESYGYQITDISPRGEMNILVKARRDCYNSTGDLISGTGGSTYISLGVSPYILSVSNSFFAIGCPNQGYFVDLQGYYVSGCVSACRPPQYSLGTTNGSCTGVGCCQSSIPNGLSYYEPYSQNFEKSTNGTGDPILFVNPTNCSYVFLADSNWFRFDTSYLSRTTDFKVQLRIDWAVRNVGNCSYAKRNMTDYACRSANHDCYNSDNGAGYLCNCSKSYQGNPYIIGGCQGIIILSKFC
jgi:Wall-associated receptor kinase galacturonan-binding